MPTTKELGDATVATSSKGTKRKEAPAKEEEEAEVVVVDEAELSEDEGQKKKRAKLEAKEEKKAAKEAEKKAKAEAREAAKQAKVEAKEAEKRAKAEAREADKQAKAAAKAAAKEEAREEARKARAVAKVEKKDQQDEKSAAEAEQDKETWDWPDDKEERKQLAGRLQEMALARGVAMPTDETQGLIAAGKALTTSSSDGLVNVGEAMEALLATYGSKKPDKKKAASKAKQAKCPENQEMAEAFRKLAGNLIKEGEKMKGFAFMKASTALKEHDEVFTRDNVPKPGKIKGVGKGSIKLMNEFLETGTIAWLDEFKSMAD